MIGRHIHLRQSEMFKVIQGKLGIIHNEEEIVLTPDMSTLVVKPGVRYSFSLDIQFLEVSPEISLTDIDSFLILNLEKILSLRFGSIPKQAPTV